MSTKRKHGKAKGVSLDHLMERHITDQYSMSFADSQDKIMLILRLGRETLASGEGNAETWKQMAGVLNVCGLYALEHFDPDSIECMVLAYAAEAMRSIEQRHRRVGGRYGTTQDEVEAITAALNLIDVDIMPRMSLLQFMGYAKRVDRMHADYTAGRPNADLTYATKYERLAA